MTGRQHGVKSLLWLIVGALSVVTVARFMNGLGATTNLNDASPWGLWIAFDVMAGVALAAGGFVLAATVHIFHIENYRCFVRPAILTALLGYTAVAVGLLYDLGLPWHIWHPLVFPQPHSVLFEVAMCVMLYLTVLFLEFSPVILEHPKLNNPLLIKLHKLITRVSIPLVIAGVVLSTLHQSSLGSLFLITPYRLHPLWYSPIIWVMFFVSAVGLGLLTVILESFFSAWLFGHKLHMNLLGGLGKAAAVVLAGYGLLRIGEVALRGELPAAFDGSFEGNTFLIEIAMSAVLPAVLFSMHRVRANPYALGWTALIGVLGIIGYRFDVCLVAFRRPMGVSYFPSWMELVVTLGIVAGATLVFIWFVEHLRVYPEEHSQAEADPASKPSSPAFATQGLGWILPESLAAPRRYSLAALVGSSLAIFFLPSDAIFGTEPMAVPVQESRSVEGVVRERGDAFGHELFVPDAEALTDPAASPSDRVAILTVIDGNRDGRLVLFDHENHETELDEADSCVLCHHENIPFQENSQCFSCHRDMYSTTDIFDHFGHVAHFDGNPGCVRCHESDGLPKTRENSKACEECHEDMLVEGTRVELPAEGQTGLAVGYMQAMHGLCITCHEERVEEQPEKYAARFAECNTCHREDNGSALRRLLPYLAKPAASESTIDLTAQADLITNRR